MTEFLLLCLWLLITYTEQIFAACLYGVAAAAWGIAMVVIGMIIILISR